MMRTDIEQIAINHPDEFIEWAKANHGNCPLGNCEIARDLIKYHQGLVAVQDFFEHTKPIEDSFYESFEKHLMKKQII